jgi:hypothetical protein
VQGERWSALSRSVRKPPSDALSGFSLPNRNLAGQANESRMTRARHGRGMCRPPGGRHPLQTPCQGRNRRRPPLLVNPPTEVRGVAAGLGSIHSSDGARSTGPS